MHKGLNTYVREQLQRGYHPETIRNALIRAGYNPQDINFALHISAKPKKQILITGKSLALTIGIMFTMVLLFFTGMLIFGSGDKEIQISLQVEKPQLAPGETLELSTALVSIQSRQVPVSLEYIISNPATRKIVTSRSERLNVGESAVSSESIPLPQTLEAGEYEVRLIVKFEGLTRVKTAKFTIQQQISAPDFFAAPEEFLGSEELIEAEPTEVECPASCDDLNPATEDYCERGSCVHKLLSDVCGNGRCEEGENRISCAKDCGGEQEKEVVLAQALQQATLDIERAATLCNSLIIPEDADPCFAAIANTSQKSQLCINIKDLRNRDNCLMEFAFAKDYSVCSQLSNRFLITSCVSLSRLNSAPPDITVEEITN